MNLLDRYIFKSVFFTCAAAVGLFASVLILGNALKDLLGYLLSEQIDPLTFGRLLLLLVPFVICYALPMGMITGVLLTLGRLSADSEITAMRAAGIGLLRIARPVLLLGVLGLGLALYVNFEAMPRARVQFHRELDKAVTADPLRMIVPKTFMDFNGMIVYIGEKDGPVLRDIWLYKLDLEKRMREFARAESGEVRYDEATNELILVGKNAKVEKRETDNPEDLSKAPPIGTVGATEPWRLSAERIFGRRSERRRIDWMTQAEIEQELARVVAGRATATDAREQARAEMRVKMSVQEKLTTALSVLTFAIIGVPLGIKVSRRETSANLGIGLALVLGYYFLTVMVKWLDRHPEYRPDLLLSVPNLIFLALAIWLFRRVEK